MIPYGRQDINQNDIDSVVDVLKSDFLTQGSAIPAFENATYKYCGASFGVCTTNATAALHLACMALDVGAGDIVWTSPISFVASANCARYCGADVDFVDIDSNSYNMSVSALEAKLQRAKDQNKLPKVVIPVHLTGQSCDMKGIHALSEKYGFRIIEDASHAIGSDYLNEKVGNCRYSDITVFSFHPVKIITTGEGGIALTNDDVLAGRMELLRSHGITRNQELMTEDSHGGWYYQQLQLGFNYRMTDIQAALGLSQLQRVDEMITQRRHFAARYNELLDDLPLTLPWQDPDAISAWHLYVIRLNLGEISKSHRKIFTDLRSNGIGVNLHYIPIYLQPYYKELGFRSENFPNANEYYETAISIPLFSSMTEQQQDEVSKVLHEIIE